MTHILSLVMIMPIQKEKKIINFSEGEKNLQLKPIVRPAASFGKLFFEQVKPSRSFYKCFYRPQLRGSRHVTVNSEFKSWTFFGRYN